MAWTIANNVIDAWIGDDEPTDTILIDTWIGKAERLIRFKIPGIQARITAAEVDLLENVVDVTAAMVIRKFRNPEGIRQSNTTTGPFTESRTYGGNEPGELVLQDDELARLSGSTGGGRAFSISTIPTTSPFYVAP
jgi:hypothetical protein